MVIKSTFQERCLIVEAPTELSYMTSGISFLLILTNIPGNLLIILAVLVDPNKNLRSPFNWLALNLAAADLMVGCITEPLSAYHHIREGLRKKIMVEEYVIIRAIFFISCTASVLSLTSLAAERYLAVRKPVLYRTSVTNKRIVLTIVGIWVISFSLPSIYLVVGFGIYGFLFANASIAFAVIVICITYTLIKRKVKQRSPDKHKEDVPKTSTDAQNPPSQVQGSSNVNTNATSTPSIIKRRQLMEAKVTKMFLIVLIALLCCYGPSTLMMYIVTFCQSCDCLTLHWFRDLYFLFALMNSSVNFFCYALRSQRIRSAFLKLIRIKRRQEDRASSSQISTMQDSTGVTTMECDKL